MRSLRISLASFFCWSRSGRAGRARRNADDMDGLLRSGRRPRIGPKEVVSLGQIHFQVGAALSADRWRPARTYNSPLERAPLPQAVRHRRGQTVPELSGHHDNLTAMMRFMPREVREHVTDIERQVPPGIRWRRWNPPTRVETERENRLDAFAALSESR